MSDFHVNLEGKWAVSDIMLSMPLSGLWVATLALTDVKTIPAVATLHIGSTAWTGIPDMVGDYAGQTSLRLVGGGLAKASIPGAYFSGVAFKAILTTACTAAGVLVTTDLDTTATSWTRPACTLACEVDRIARHAGKSWRALPNGKLWLGSETWPEIKPIPQLRFAKASEKMREYYTDEPTLTPGKTVSGFRISHAVFFANHGASWTRIYTP